MDSELRDEMLIKRIKILYARVSSDPAFEHLRSTGADFVPGEGPLTARIAIVGEAPGATENRYRRPFIGAAGRRLDELLDGINISRADVFITNVLKFRPPDNRAPTVAEVAAARPWLHKELDLVEPRIVVLLGRTAVTAFFPGVRVGAVHGRVIGRGRRIYLPAFHPSYALQNPTIDAALVADFNQLARLTGQSALCPR